MRIRGMMLKTIKNTLLFFLCLVVLSGCFTREGTIVGGKVYGGSNSIDGKYKNSLVLQLKI